MRYLLDTHILIWYSTYQPLSSRIMDIINDTANTILVSHATLWEMTIKISIGKLDISRSMLDFTKLLTANQFEILPFELGHYGILEKLPFHHQDPVDRMLIAQAIAEDIILISVDQKFSLYDVSLIAS
jgi:PIN domain nuclease of toxin-antitoxin system